MTKDEILQKVNDYCNEKSYTESTLTTNFKDKFADHFIKAYPDGKIDDEQVIANMKFAINSAFSSASSIISDNKNAFAAKETDYQRQIQELTEKLAKANGGEPNKGGTDIPDDVKKQLAELEAFKTEQKQQELYNRVIDLAKKDIRRDLHGSFEKYAKDYKVSLDKGEQEQATELVTKFQDIFMDTIGEIKPLKPHQNQKRDEEFLSNVKKVKVC